MWASQLQVKGGGPVASRNQGSVDTQKSILAAKAGWIRMLADALGMQLSWNAAQAGDVMWACARARISQGATDAGQRIQPYTTSPRQTNAAAGLTLVTIADGTTLDT